MNKRGWGNVVDTFTAAYMRICMMLVTAWKCKPKKMRFVERDKIIMQMNVYTMLNDLLTIKTHISYGFEKVMYCIRNVDIPDTMFSNL